MAGLATIVRVAEVLFTAFFFGLTFEGIGRKITARIQKDTVHLGIRISLMFSKH